MKFTFKVHREGDVLWAESLELKGLSTDADTLPDLIENVKIALVLHLSDQGSFVIDNVMLVTRDMVRLIYVIGDFERAA